MPDDERRSIRRRAVHGYRLGARRQRSDSQVCVSELLQLAEDGRRVIAERGERRMTCKPVRGSEQDRTVCFRCFPLRPIEAPSRNLGRDQPRQRSARRQHRACIRIAAKHNETASAGVDEPHESHRIRLGQGRGIERPEHDRVVAE